MQRTHLPQPDEYLRRAAGPSLAARLLAELADQLAAGAPSLADAVRRTCTTYLDPVPTSCARVAVRRAVAALPQAYTGESTRTYATRLRAAALALR